MAKVMGLGGQERPETQGNLRPRHLAVEVALGARLEYGDVDLVWWVLALLLLLLVSCPRQFRPRHQEGGLEGCSLDQMKSLGCRHTAVSAWLARTIVLDSKSMARMGCPCL